MGNKPSNSIVPDVSSTASTSTPTTNITTTITPITTTSTTPTPAITSTLLSTKDTSPTVVSTEGTSKPTFHSIVTQFLTSDAATPGPAVTSAATRWYNWTKYEQQKREKDKVLWYMKPPTTSADIPNIVPTTTAKTNDDQKEKSDQTNIIAIPTFQLRSTAVYSPPHGDRIPSSRSELINTDVSNFKYYQPDNRIRQSAGIHTKATMYQMNTRLKQTSLPTQSSSLTTTNPTGDIHITKDASSLRTFVSRGLQTDLEAHPIDSSSTQMRYYEKQQSQVLPLSVLSNYDSNNHGFYHMSSQDTTSQPILPPIEKTPVWIGDQPQSSVLPNPSQPSALPPSILKKSSTSLSSKLSSNPLSEQTHDQVREELRKRYKNAKDGTYRVKKVHLLEKSEHPPKVSFHLPITKASQSINRSERLFSSQSFNRKK